MSNLFSDLKTFVLGTNTNSLDQQIDTSLQSIELYSSKNSFNKYVQAIRDIVSKTTVADPNDILRTLQAGPQIQNYDQTGRLSRYVEYEAILNKISYCQRALITLTDHIISPDDITKRSILFLLDETAPDSTKSNVSSVIARLKTISKKIGIENKIDKLVKTTLKKGDYFVEILYSPRGQNALTILKEGKEIALGSVIDLEPVIVKNEVTEDSKENGEKEFQARIIVEDTVFGGVYSTVGPAMWTGAGANVNQDGPRPTYMTNAVPDTLSKDKHVSKPTEPEKDPKFKSKYSEDEKNNKTPEMGPDEKFPLKDLFITLHNPKFVIRLETERFRTCLGFLVFPKMDPALASSSSFMNFSTNIIDGICSQIISRVHDSIKNKNDKIKISDEMKEVVLQYLKVLKNNEDLKVRYVPPEMMIHWRINVDKYDPYGESIFDCVNFDCRLLTALKTANTIKRLTSSTDKRTIYVETGLPRDAKNIIETLKEGLGKRKISIDKMGSIDTIPTQINTFETTYIPMRDGKRFVEIEKQEWGQNASEDIEPLKFIRDGIVANLGVPAPYLGLEENTSNRSLLTAENINFCRTIISYQKEFSIFLKEIFEKIYKLVYSDNDIPLFENIKITFPEPKISPYEHEMEYVEQMQRLIEALKQLDVPVEWMKKKYLPHIDWDELKKYKAQENIEKELSETPPDQMAGMGGAGGVMPGGGGLY